MIVPMKKVSLVVLDAEKKDALKNLRKLGVVHLESLEGKGSELSSLKDSYASLQNAVLILGEIKLSKKQDKALKAENAENVEVSKDFALEKANEVLALTAKNKEFTDDILNLNKELDRLKAWKNFDPKEFAFLNEKGIHLLPYEVPTEVYKSKLDPDIKYLFVNSDKSKVRILVISEDGEKPASMVTEALPVAMSEFSTEEMLEKIKQDKTLIAKNNELILGYVQYVPAIKNAMKLFEKDIEFENTFSGMETDGENGQKATLAWLTGYVPAEDMKQVSQCAKENGWAFIADDPEVPEEVPTKLKNNKFVSLIYPLTDFLGTIPGYAEYDISGWFLLFFCIFFGMIFGDGGYGLLITIFTIIMMIKSSSKKQKTPPLLKLMLLLGISTVIWGYITCTWFGLSPDVLRSIGLGFLPDYSLKVLSSAYQYLPDGTERIWQIPWCETGVGLTTAQNLQIFCFTLALLQLSVAHIKGIARYIKSPKFLGELGSLMQLWGMFYVVLSMVVNGSVFPLGLQISTIGSFELKMMHIVIALIGVGFVLSFIFSNYAGSVGKSILESCKNIISVLLGVVNVFSDIVSYIRLWAVGLAGAAISNTVNTMAGPILGHAILFILGVVLLVFGHGLNMILNLLSVIVHGVRLNTLEFSNHLGMSWSGFKYEPFRE